MRPKPTYRLCLPSSIKNIIDSNVSRNREAYYYVVHALIVKSINYGNKTDEYFPLNYSSLKKIINCNPKYIIRRLVQMNIIFSDGIYSPGKKRMYYKINLSYYNNCAFYDISPDMKIYDTLSKIYTRKNINRKLKHIHLIKMFKHYQRIEYDFDKAIKWINSKDFPIHKKKSYIYSVLMLRDNYNRRFSRNKTNNRLDTNFTNMYNPLKNFIINSEELVQIDLKNSQPTFLALLLKSIINIIHNKSENSNNQGNVVTYPYCCQLNLSKYLNPIPASKLQQLFNLLTFKDYAKSEEFKKLLKWTLSGKFYDNLQNAFSVSLDRKSAKEITFKIFFSKNTVKSFGKDKIPFASEKNKFAKVFPITYKAIQILKSHNNSDLANMLSKLEASIFIDIISKNLVEAGIIPLTIHDSIIINKKDLYFALLIMESTFLEIFNSKPTFSVEPL